MPTEYFYNKEAQDIDEIKMEEGKLELREGERFVTCGSCMKHTRIVEKGSDEPFFEKCDNCAESVQKANIEADRACWEEDCERERRQLAE